MDVAYQPQEPPRLKACETCFRAKIRCNRTQDSGSCDRCLRLGKGCVFAVARHRKPPRSRAADRFLEVGAGRATGLRTPSPIAVSPGRRHGRATSRPGSSPATEASPSAASGTFDPVANEGLTEQQSTALLHIYNSRMSPHFPFVRLPATMPIDTLRQERPCLYLAVLAAASYDDIRLQRSLSRSFDAAVAARLLHGGLVSLDSLQGLLVHNAWAHYRPRRQRKYSQYLHLATSIVSDFRLDRPKDSTLWSIEKAAPGCEQEPHWTAEELRALIGTYYLASNSSVVLQKLRHIPYSGFMLESGMKLAAAGEYPTDMYLPHIVRLQKLSEEIDAILGDTPNTSSLDVINGRISQIRTELESFKSALCFPLSDCSVLSLQVSFLELLLGQMALPGFPFGHERLQRTIADGSQLADCLAQAVSACKSLISFLLNMTPGEEFVITNMAWVMLHCVLSLAVRLDVLARDSRIAHLTQHLVQFLDMQHSLRQVNLRLESAASAYKADDDSDDDPSTFRLIVGRARAIESWHQRQTAASSSSRPPAPGDLPGSTPTVHVLPAADDGTSPATDESSLFGAETSFIAPGPIDGTLTQAGDYQDFSVTDFLSFDAHLPEFNPYTDDL